MSKYLTFVKISSIEQSSKRQYGDKHFTGVKTDFGLKEKIMVFTKGDEKKWEVNEIKEVKEESTICELCGATYKGMTYKDHEQRQFHRDRL